MSAAITLNEARDYLQVTGPESNAMIQTLIDTAEACVERWCGIKLIVPTADLSEDLDGGTKYLFTEYRPIFSLTSVVDNEDASILSSDYYVTRNAEGIIEADYGIDEKFYKGKKRWKVNYKPGHANAAAVPLDVKMMILKLTKTFFDRRSEYPGESVGDWSYSLGPMYLPTDLIALINRYVRRMI